MNRLVYILVLLPVLLLGNAYAVQDVELENSADEPRFVELSNILRCMVCQNQSIADSNAPLARDFRNQVKEKINQGQSNDQIINYMVERYGDYILYRPPFNAATALLWTGPFILVFIGLFVVSRLHRRKAVVESDTDDLLQANRDRLKEMLNEKDEKEGQG